MNYFAVLFAVIAVSASAQGVTPREFEPNNDETSIHSGKVPLGMAPSIVPPFPGDDSPEPIYGTPIIPQPGDGHTDPCRACSGIAHAGFKTRCLIACVKPRPISHPGDGTPIGYPEPIYGTPIISQPGDVTANV